MVCHEKHSSPPKCLFFEETKQMVSMSDVFGEDKVDFEVTVSKTKYETQYSTY